MKPDYFQLDDIKHSFFGLFKCHRKDLYSVKLVEKIKSNNHNDILEVGMEFEEFKEVKLNG